MRRSLTLATAALASTAAAQSASSLTFWLPGPANNPSGYGLGTSTYPPVASIISSNPSTTVFALGCPTSAGTPSSIYNGAFYETCRWSTDYGTYSIISSTKHVLHRTQDDPTASMWWTCDYDVAATKIACDMEVSGDVNDNTGGPISGLVWNAEPDRLGNVFAFATAEVVTEGQFGEPQCTQDASASVCDSNGSGGKGTASATASEPTLTASQGSGSGAFATVSSTASGSAATTSTGAAGGFGVNVARLSALLGGAVVAAW